MSRRFKSGFLAALLLLAPLGAAASNAADSQSDNQLDSFTANFSDYLSFVGGVPLTAEQRRRVADQTAADLRANAESVRATAKGVRDLLPKLEAGDESTIGKRRETLRYQMSLAPAENLGRVLVEQNDPTVVVDPKHQRIITQRSLEALQRACTWVAGLLDVPGPQANFVVATRSFFHDHYGELTNDQQESLAHVERDLPLLIEAYQHADASKKARFTKAAKPFVRGHDELAPLTIGLLGGARSAIDNKIITDSILVMGQMNNTMLFHQSYLLR